MKARIKGTNIEIDVHPFYDETGYFSGFKDGCEYYRAADLVFPDTLEWDKTDWSSFRREAANDLLAGILAHAGFSISENDARRLTRLALTYADELIKQLKEEQK